MNQRDFHPETLMMSYGYKPELSEGAIKSPIFQTSTFVFKNAEEGKAFFEVAYGLRDKGPTEELGLIYSRINNPSLEILENRLSLWDNAGDCAVFESGMSAITTVLLEFLKPGDLLLHSGPLYGGTDHFIKHFLVKIGVTLLEFHAGQTQGEIVELIEGSGKKDKLAFIYIETPANPTNALIDIGDCKDIAGRYGTKDKPVTIAVDNTYMGPLWQHPLQLGADFSLYSATKYIGGHSDVIAGAVCGSKEMISRVKTLRTFLGNMAGPWTGWLLLRSLETMKVRMEKQAANARVVADHLLGHAKVEKVYYLGHISEKDKMQYAIYKKQYSSAGAMLSFDIKGGEKEAFRFLNALKLVKLAVSLGGTESLAEHPSSMTHAGVDPDYRKRMAISEKMIRISIGVEHADDLIWDLDQALDKA
ncbi:MAG: cystathionine gamma-synthase family protein [Cyclobacteriaceae bacterium]|nr:cystathionine gamma-synthase family protein [Cyclobacteriaceae bacterium]MCB0499932.1 cystathionine gamma-synthase family protein [Cyclobacteriaceae bacterium]MCB9237250.1 cystathionine gamma-synthase family protein [Flammeovirgaceae bacterium]MCO5270960.1 cystathionine gamma-synthase family protein [Cyclobacteriaceae bacterium]MCW5901754.1 cystathionine gamma-synthase family protein [Cyclobacteriaceae bacterium]